MFRPGRSSSGPSRTQNQALFSFPALWDPKQEQKVHKLVKAYILFTPVTETCSIWDPTMQEI